MGAVEQEQVSLPWKRVVDGKADLRCNPHAMSLSVILTEEHLRRAHLGHHTCHNDRHTSASVYSTSDDTHRPEQIAHLCFVLVASPASRVRFCNNYVGSHIEIAGIGCPEDVSGVIGLGGPEGVVEGMDCVVSRDALGEFES